MTEADGPTDGDTPRDDGNEETERTTAPPAGEPPDDSVEGEPTEDNIEFARQLAREQLESAREKLRRAWRDHDLARGQRALVTAHGWRVALQQIREAQSETRTVHIDSLVLSDCYQTLFVDPDIETIVYLTGMELSDRDATVNRRVEMDHEVQTAVKAAGTPEGSFDTLLELEKSGHQLLAHCHNHPGASGAAPKPSDVDRSYQEKLEGGGYDAVGLIMSIDGYVRVFTNDLDVDVTVHGNHVKRLDESKLYLEEPAPTPSQPENWIVASRDWQLISEDPLPKHYQTLTSALESDPELFGNTGRAVSSGTEVDASLAVVEPESATIRRKSRKNNRDQPRLQFELGHVEYDLPITGPGVKEKVFDIVDQAGSTPLDEHIATDNTPLITVSLGEEFERKHWKLVAAIFSIPQKYM